MIRNSQMATYTYMRVLGSHIGNIKTVAKVSSPIEPGGLTWLCTEIHPKFYSPTWAGKEKPFVPNRHHQIMIIKAALATSFKPPHYDSNPSSLLLSSSGSFINHTGLWWINTNTPFLPPLSPRWEDQQYRCTSFLLHCSLEADGWNP